MPTYGGDEVNALVIDVGSTWTRAGFAGEDLPRALFPSHVGYIESEVDIAEASDDPKPAAVADTDVEMGDASSANGATKQQAESDERVTAKGEGRKQKTRKYYVGDTESATWRAGMEIGGPLEQGLVSDWDVYEKIWEYAFKSRLHVRPEEHPVMVSEAAWNTSALRAKLVEMAFEKFNSPAFYVCKTPVLSAFGAGKHTGLVVDVGGDMTSTCAVYEGFCLTKSLCKQELGGELISEQILEKLKEEYDYELTPLFDIKSKAQVETLQKPVLSKHDREGTTSSYLSEMRLRAVQELKESVCEFIERPYDARLVGSKPQKPFEFPDGFNISVGALRFAMPEILFNPNQFLVKRPKRFENTSLLGLHEMVVKSVMASDVDLRPQLLNNVVLAGGSSLFPSYPDRMAVMLQDACPGSRIKFSPLNSKTERKATAWLGGSILASLGTFHQLWISRAEYDEHGASIVDKKCQ
ncbi:NuA4 histone acetyltransferase subunit [Coemansia thaxteri]|uniref:NuA4 histone acetyltransferase subunit n=1 Tax=Coemansia thaxteri TaxID=2663907 RepID=A0A9W8EHL1_9FUNG|nr:NuA4 histone acetyltransferase subunit [Coemansia thaxteri]KAJ2009060.1 NuA4 histone acetyltransferase subunit [Coemansia thaxteri]KAJ2485897.1 NuA4 histone acetyltransferase subunit [Coemansia sp. RSA 2320]